MKFNLEVSNVFLSTSSVDPRDLVYSPILISQMGKVRLRQFKKFAPYNHRVHLFYVFANSLMLFTEYTQLVLNQCQLTRPNWPKAHMLAFCCSELAETV